MKKLIAIAIALFSIIGISSCDYDDSNDLDVITPNDSIDSKVVERPKF